MGNIINSLSSRLMLLFAFILIFSSVFFGYLTFKNTDEPKNLIKKSNIYLNIVKECRDSIDNLKIFKSEFIKSTNSIKIEIDKVENPVDILYKSSIVRSECKKFTMESYCMGETCSSNNRSKNDFSMVLKLIENK